MLGRTWLIGFMILALSGGLGHADEWAGEEVGVPQEDAAEDAPEDAPEKVPTNFGRGGAYLGINAAFLLDQSTSDVYGNAADTGGVEVYGGLRFNPYLAGELLFDYTGAINGFSFGPRFKYFFLTDRIQPYLSMGIGLLNAKSENDHHDWGGLWRPGGGLDWYLNDNIAFGTSIEYLYGLGRWKEYRSIRFGFGSTYRW